MDNIKTLISLVEKEEKEVEDLAFTIFCKEQIRLRLEDVQEEEKRLKNCKKRVEDLTTEKLHQAFQDGNFNVARDASKEHYINTCQ